MTASEQPIQEKDLKQYVITELLHKISQQLSANWKTGDRDYDKLYSPRLQNEMEEILELAYEAGTLHEKITD